MYSGGWFDCFSQGQYQSIISNYEQGRLPEAERDLRQILSKNPADFRALSLLGVVLDGQKKFEEAERVYLKAVALAPSSDSLQNNLGNHYLARGDSPKARQAFTRVLALNPAHSNANLQMAQLALESKEYPLAMRHLSRLPASEQSSFPVKLLRLRTLWGNGQKAEADKLAELLETEAGTDLRLRFSLGLAYVAMERFEEAENTFSTVLQANPANFEVLYNLGMAAFRANHADRAVSVLQQALAQKPGDVDTLVGLARSLSQAGKDSQALTLLVQANRAKPDRPDILLLMAQTSYKLGYFSDTAIAYDKYLKLKPDDDVARRERGFNLARSFRVTEGLQDLEWYVRKHPKDPWGYYQLSAAQSVEEKGKALESINKALALDPDFHEARYARATLYLQLNRGEEAVPDLKAYLEYDPNNIQALDQMGRALLKLNQPEEAARCLEKAIVLKPEEGALYFQYSRALRVLGRNKEVVEALAKFKALGGDKVKVVPPPGFFDYLSLSPAEQQAKYVADLKRTIEQRPSDTDYKLRLAEVYFRQDRPADAFPLMEQVRQLSSDPNTMSQAGRILLEARQYQAALPFLEIAVSGAGRPEEVLLDYILTVYHVSGPETALQKLNGEKLVQTSGNCLLLRAQLLDALGKLPEAVDALNLALESSPTRPDLYLEAALFLVKHEKFPEALNLIKLSEKHIPRTPNLMLLKAITSEFLNFTDDASRELSAMQSLWPEWYLPYLTHGIILQNQHQSLEAKQLLETAIALGSQEPTAYFYLSLAMKDLNPKEDEAAYQVIEKALKINPKDPFFQAQAGKLAMGFNNYAKAEQHLLEAIRLQPELVDAHWTLAGLYRATGKDEKQKAELAEVNRLYKLHPPGEYAPLPMKDILFSVDFPGKNEK